MEHLKVNNLSAVNNKVSHQRLLDKKLLILAQFYLVSHKIELVFLRSTIKLVFNRSNSFYFQLVVVS